MGDKAFYAVCGAGGHGREAMPLAKLMLARERNGAELVFVEENPPAELP